MFVVKSDKPGDVKALGAVVRTVAAGGTGQGLPAQDLVGDLHQFGQLALCQGLLGLEGMYVVLELGHVGHAGEDHSHLGDGLEEPEGPGGSGLVGAQGVQAPGVALAQLGETSAPEGLHDPDGDVVLLQQLHLGPGVLEGPVQIVDLELAELNMVPVGLQEAAHHRHTAVGGEAQVPDAAVGFLGGKVSVDAVLGIQVGIDVHFADIVEEVEVEIVHLALFQLGLEDLLHPAHVVQVVAWELGGQIEALPGAPGKGPAQGQLGLAAVVAPGGVIVVDAMLHGVVHHLLSGGLVDLGVFPLQHRQTHGAQAQSGQPDVLKLLVDHIVFLLMARWPMYCHLSYQTLRGIANTFALLPPRRS